MRCDHCSIETKVPVSERRSQGGRGPDSRAALELAGWNISRSGLSKIENCTLYVPEFRLFYLAHVFGLSNPMPLFPAIDPRKPVHEALLRLIHNEKRGLIQPATADAVAPALLDKARKHF